MTDAFCTSKQALAEFEVSTAEINWKSILVTAVDREDVEGRDAADDSAAGALAEGPPLLIPPHGQVLSQLFQAEAVGFVAAKNGLDDVRREAGQA